MENNQSSSMGQHDIPYYVSLGQGQPTYNNYVDQSQAAYHNSMGQSQATYNNYVDQSQVAYHNSLGQSQDAYNNFLEQSQAAYHQNSTSTVHNSPSKTGKVKVKRKSPQKPQISKEERLKTPDKKFGGLTEEVVKTLLLPDHLAENLDIIFIGINPGLMSAYKGHHYCNANNHFWPLLFDSGLIPEKLTYEYDYRCLEYGIGMTNIVARTTRNAAELSRQEIAAGKESCIQMIKRLNPLVLCFNGKGIYEIFSGGKCEVGRQADIFNTAVYVMPSTSGLVAQYPSKKDKLIFFTELKNLRDEMKKKVADTNLATQPPPE